MNNYTHTSLSVCLDIAAGQSLRSGAPGLQSECTPNFACCGGLHASYTASPSPQQCRKMATP
jgi:hypothetical protein